MKLFRPNDWCHARRSVLAALTFCIGAGQATASEPIVLGQSIDTGPGNYMMASRWQAGARLYIKAVNAVGGINGRPVELVTLDDGGDVERHLQNIRTLINRHKAIAIINCVGDAICHASAGLTEETGVPLVGTISGTKSFDPLRGKNVFSIRQGYEKEAAAIAAQMAIMGIGKAAILTDRAGRSERVEALSASLGKARIAAEVLSVHNPDASELGNIVERIRGNAYHAVVMDLDAVNVANLAGRGFFKHPVWPNVIMSFSDAALVSISRVFQNRMVGFTSVVPNPEAHSLPLTLELQRHEKRFNEPAAMSLEGMESYINTKICIEALRQAGSNVSPGRVSSALRMMHRHDLGGYIVSFSRGEAAGSSWMEIGLKSANGVFLR